MINDLPYSLDGKRVWVAGATGLVGSALARRLADENCTVLPTSSADVDLRRQADVEAWLRDHSPDAVFVAAGTVGGIHANDTRPAEFIYDNAAMVSNVIEGAHRTGVEKLMLLGSSCIYPRLADQPMQEDAILTGPLEPTNEWYAVAKITGVKMCQAYRRQYGCDFVAVIPANLYGPGDNFDPEEGHVIPGLMRRIAAAKSTGGPVTVWGTGTPRRDFLYIDDAADALVFLMQSYSDEPVINAGSNGDISIADLASAMADVMDYDGGFEFDTSKPDGMPRKRLDASQLAALGWTPKTPLRDGLSATYEWFLTHVATSEEGA